MATFLFNTKTLKKMISDASSEANVIGISINYPFEEKQTDLAIHAVPMKFTQTGSTSMNGTAKTRFSLTESNVEVPGVLDCPKPPDCNPNTVKSIITILNLPLPLPE